MAKPVRSRSSHRPGGQGPSRTKKTADASASSADDVSQATTDADIDSAIEATGAQASMSTLEQPATTAPATKSKRRAGRRNKATRPSDLAAKAAAEDVWVRADLRRIGVVSVILLAALAIAWVVFVPLDVLNLY